MPSSTLAILGCGNMAAAIVSGVPAAARPFTFVMLDVDSAKATALAAQVGGRAVASYADLPACDAYLLACKPQQFPDLARALAPRLTPTSLVLSIMTGISTAKIHAALPQAHHIVRIMPNTPCLVNAGVSGIFFQPHIDATTRQLVLALFAPISAVFTFNDEATLDVVTAATGSGPAYVFEIADAMIEATVAMGIDAVTAAAMIKQLFFGASCLMMESENSPALLRNNVTSAGGTTAAALDVLSAHKFRAIFAQAMQAAKERSEALGK